jgi:ubiquinone/menaquinone biosynthesis C-methylase UbiE
MPESMIPDARDFYEQLYHFDRDVVVAGEERLAKALDQLEPLAGTTFLDLGSGVGWAAHMASERGAKNSVGVDFAAKALKLGAEHVPGVARAQADGCALPLRDGSVDRVLSFGSLEHFPDVNRGLREIARVLSADGRAVVVVPNFHVRTEQPTELRLSYQGWKKRFTGAGLRVTHTGADHGPGVLRDKKPARVALRAAARTAGIVPGLQYQFIFTLAKALPETD